GGAGPFTICSARLTAARARSGLWETATIPTIASPRKLTGKCVEEQRHRSCTGVHVPGTALTEVARPTLARDHGYGCVPAGSRGITRSGHCVYKITTILDDANHGVQSRRERIHHGLVTGVGLPSL